MKLTNQEMININNALVAIGDKEDIDPVIGVTIARNSLELKKMIGPIGIEEDKLLEKYGLHDADGKLIVNPDKSIPLTDGNKYRAERERLLNAECEISLTKLSMEDIYAMRPTPNQIAHLLPIVDEQTDTQEA